MNMGERVTESWYLLPVSVVELGRHIYIYINST